MSEMQKKPSRLDLCQLALEENGYNFYKMEKGFNQLGWPYRYMVSMYKRSTDKTYTICFFSVRDLINWSYKKEFISFNPYGINKKNYVFQKKAIDCTSYNGNKLKKLSQLKYVKND